MNWMILPLKRYAEFSGRSRRMEYWMFTLFLILASVVILGIEMVAGIDETFGAAGGPLSLIFTLATLVPSISVGVRRLHDIDRTGWWIAMPFSAALLLGFALATEVNLLAVVAGIAFFVGVIALFIFAVSDGTRGPNRFGADPKGPGAVEELA